MFAPSKVPLAWLNLTHDRRRFLVALGGITFAVLLMFMQLGFWNALLNSTAALIRKFKAELVLISAAKYSLTVTEPFSERRLYQARGVAGVRDAAPLYIENFFSLWKNPDPGHHGVRPIRVLAFDPTRDLLAIDGVEQYRDRLRQPDTALLDVKSKADYTRWPRAGLETELAQRRVRVVGTFALGTDFATDGTLIMSDRSFARYFPLAMSPHEPLTRVEVGLLQLEQGADPAAVKQALQQTLPEDVAVLTREEFAVKEMDFWRTSTPVGFIFLLGLVMGFIVGTVICFQILSADVSDHLAEFATLKAIGYPNRYLNAVVLQEALLLAGLGFVPGVLVSAVLYAILEAWTGLPMRLDWWSGGFVLVLTIGMCILSGLIAVRKVQTADPAEVF
jgi:putative ABC transport system permease protein